MNSTFERGRGDQLYFRHTFVPVDFLVRYLAEGQDLSAFLTSFPGVTRAQAVSAILSAGEALKEKYPADESSF